MNTTTLPPAGEGPDEVSASSDREKAKRRRPLKFVVEHWLGLVAAILGLTTALLAPATVVVVGDRDDLEVTVNDLEENNASLRDRVDALDQENDDLEAENDDLHQQVEELRRSDGPTTTATSTPPASPEAFRTTGDSPLAVRAGFGIDIDSQEPDWGVDGTGGDDFGVSDGADSVFGGSFGDVKFALVNQRPTFAECEAQTVLQTHLEVEQTVAGQQMCVLSSEGRRAYVRIAGIDTDAETMSFDITVWKLPTDP